MEKILKFILDEMPVGAMVFDEKMRVIYQNGTADKFLRRYGIARELTAVVGKIFRERHTADKNTLSKSIAFRWAGKDMPFNLSIKHLYSEEPYPRILVFICTKPCNSELQVEEVISRYNFTIKEAEIFRQLVRGLKNTEIARELHIQASTARDHLRSIYAKCGVKNKSELVRYIIT